MSKKFRLKEVEIDGYYFTNIPALFWHSGKFWYNEIEVNSSLTVSYNTAATVNLRNF